MIFGFAIKKANGGTTFGVMKDSSEEEAKATVATQAMVSRDAVLIIPVEEALNQYDNVAFLAPVEL